MDWKFDLSDPSDFDCLLLGFGVYILALVISAVLIAAFSFSIPLLGVGLAILLYFVLIRPNDGSALWYFVGYFALLIVVVIIAVIFLGGLLFLMFI